MQQNKEIEDLKNRMEDIESRLNTMSLDYDSHDHNGIHGERINLFDIFGFIPTVNGATELAAKTGGKPQTFYDQFFIYQTSTTYRFYWYDTVNNAWRYAVGV